MMASATAVALEAVLAPRQQPSAAAAEAPSATAGMTAEEVRKQKQRERYLRRRADPAAVERQREVDRNHRRACYEERREVILAKARERRIAKRIEQLKEMAAQPQTSFARKAGRPRMEETAPSTAPSTSARLNADY